MATEKKNRGRTPGPGIPFKRQTPKQRAIVLLIKSLGSFNYSDDTTYIANKFMSNDSIIHMNMKLLAGVLQFIKEYDILGQLSTLEEEKKIKVGTIDLTQIQEVNADQISELLSTVLMKTETEEQETRRQVDFIRYLFFAINILKYSSNTNDNEDEIKELLLGS